ncbi:hypothetical protein LEP1GSC199_0857 [Leptospira vanthielii serovar Holland str. Waz Holland = ATCC 700522]|uniref:Uncharacterized protein n=1 Tax=Leptospira vanthielii serovar Holland str. Waz Holland = ATCC 700522 TaxID=1218591 RepID=N1VW39_9LEPT|nr:hypothetical protein LEP1GSC199_0857 [Leptospira vanthielii serovar Holland str. Waz Holland = ATCC 700522]
MSIFRNSDFQSPSQILGKTLSSFPSGHPFGSIEAGDFPDGGLEST